MNRLDCAHSLLCVTYAVFLQFYVWPERYYVVGADGVIVHQSYPSTEFGYNHCELRQHLEAMFPTEEPK